jgi:hypothetical protein
MTSMALTRQHHTRLREVYRSSGWPCQDLLEVDLLASGLLARTTSALGHETLRVTDAGIALLAQVRASNQAARSAHEALVEQVAREMQRAGRLVWRGLSLRAQVLAHFLTGEDAAKSEPNANDDTAPNLAWVVACPDVFSIRHTSVEAYLHPIVHEIKVSRADLLGDLKKPAKRAAYLGMGGECWYVLGQTAKGKPIAKPEEIPIECGVMQSDGSQLIVLRPAPSRAVEKLPFHVWMALAKATPQPRADGDAQQML